MEWVLELVRAYRQGDEGALSILEHWIRDWCAGNPVNVGINWKCGQEASIRGMHLIAAALMIGDPFDSPMPGLIRLLLEHGKRISATTAYAIAQDNNHGTSEAAALFVIGHYLASRGDSASRRLGMKWSKKGRRMLEERVATLIMSDGTFSQYSVVYHRMVIDTLCFAELFRRRMGVDHFSSLYYDKTKSAIRWYLHMIDPISADAPNVGANDGTQLFRFDGNPYRNFMRSANLGLAVFFDCPTDQAENRHPLLKLLSENEVSGSQPPELRSTLFAEGGFAILRDQRTLCMLRLPVFRFRPSHADALHMDLWVDGVNFLRDAGTFSYNGSLDGRDSQRWFSSTAAHNTAEFDGRDQMPVIGRFLFGKWLSATDIQFDSQAELASGAYTDWRGATHRRTVQRDGDLWRVTDHVSGFESTAAIRWRLAPSNWVVSGTTVKSSLGEISFSSAESISISIGKAAESRFYRGSERVPVVEVRLSRPGTLVTIIAPTRREGSPPLH